MGEAAVGYVGRNVWGKGRRFFASTLICWVLKRLSWSATIALAISIDWQTTKAKLAAPTWDPVLPIRTRRRRPYGRNNSWI